MATDVTGLPRLVLVEDEQLTLAGARLYLQDRFQIVGEADNVTDAVHLPQAGLPAPGREVRVGLRLAL